MEQESVMCFLLCAEQLWYG